MIFCPPEHPKRARRALLMSALTLLLLAPAPGLLAQEPTEPPAADAANDNRDESDEARATLESHELVVPDGLKVGDTVKLSVSVNHAPDLRLTVVPLPEGSRWERVALESETRDEGGQKITTFELEYAVFRPGPTRSPEVVIRALGSDGEPVEITVPRTPVHVAPISDAGAGLLSARGARALLVSDATPYLIAGGALGLLAIGAVAGLMARRRRRPEPNDAPRQPPAEEALQKLEFLANSSLLEDGEVMAFYVRLSETLRTYLGRRWGFPGTELTTTEIVARLKERATLPADLSISDLAQWLRACDRVKFAGHTPAPAEARQHLQAAFHIVERTRPRPEQTSEAGKDSTQPTENTAISDTPDKTQASQPPSEAPDASEEDAR
ncbi:hypothetical protein FRC98_06145 [Lujinxingia vulgaris]|uniref:Protein BatD n=1 Tax=Lujinxingia vulgaris TaxID=2600176 RepID=A0A5C6X9G1_9DELT|nr:hypothetical protein [Lujinxingia vulgaris]TXD38461.1 hypothetical protein FRC98_06145 [Lujinxingia vulgaris]